MTAAPPPPEPDPNPYELEAEEYLQTLIQCEEEVEDFRSEAAEKNRQLWRSEQESTVRYLAFRQDIRILEDQTRGLRRELKETEAQAANERCAELASGSRNEAFCPFGIPRRMP